MPDPNLQSAPDLVSKFTQNGCAVPRVRVPAFIAVCGNGTVNLVFKGTFEGRWSMISIRLQATGQLSHCDLVFIPRNTNPGNMNIPEVKSAFIALAGASLPNRIAIHYLTFDFPGPAPNQRPFLHGKLDCLITLPSKKLPQFSVVHVKFDQSLPMNNFSNRSLIVVRSNGKKCYISKWMPTLSESSQPSPPSYTLIKEIKPNIIPQDSPFISVVQCFKNGDILLGYFDGYLEIRNGQNLEIKEAKRIFKNENKQRKTTKTETIHEMEHVENPIIGKPFPSPLSIAVSPNQTCFCLLDYHCTLNIYVLENPFEPEAKKYLWKKISDILELCVIQGISCWDVLLFCRDSCKLYSDASSIRTVIGHMIADFKVISQDAQELYYAAFQSIFSRLLHLSETQITNQMDCQARLFVDYIYDTFFGYFTQVKVSIGGKFTFFL